jgi:hypothetical protein
VQEAAVAGARAVAAARRLHHDDTRSRLPLEHGERRPETGQAAADDRDVGLHGLHETRRGLVASRFVDPPRLCRTVDRAGMQSLHPENVLRA